MTTGSLGLHRGGPGRRGTTAITVKHGWPAALHVSPMAAVPSVRYPSGVSSPPRPADWSDSARPDRVRVLLADDARVARESITAYLESLGQMEVTAVCVDGREAVERALQDPPDVAVLDFQMPVMDGLDAARFLRSCLPGTGVILTTVNDHPQIRQACFASGADAFVAKSQLGRDLLGAIQTALAAARSPVRHLESRKREDHARPDCACDTPASG